MKVLDPNASRFIAISTLAEERLLLALRRYNGALLQNGFWDCLGHADGNLYETVRNALFLLNKEKNLIASFLTKEVSDTRRLT